MQSTHQTFMRRCLTLAQKGLGFSYPNPMVGAVVVKNGEIIGEGWHRKAGTAHAEVNALQHLHPEELVSATLYVNLEPCSHHGKTPPCCNLVIAKGIKKVVVGAVDPNPKVAGKGIQAMKKTGIHVTLGVLEKDCIELNKRFYAIHTKKRPYIILKWAQTADGFIAPEKDNKDSVFWISDKHSQQLAHRWRAEENAILVGRNTITQDNPKLTTRLWKGNHPTRLVIDPNNTISKDARVLDNHVQTIVFNTQKNENKENISWVRVNTDTLLQNIMKTCVERNIQSILVEGGEKTLTHFLNNNLWDECRIFESKNTLKSGLKGPKKPQGKSYTKTLVGDSLQIIRRQKR